MDLEAGGSVALWLGEAGGARGEGRCFDLHPRSALCRVVRRRLPGRLRVRRRRGGRDGGGSAGGLKRREEVEL